MDKMEVDGLSDVHSQPRTFTMPLSPTNKKFKNTSQIFDVDAFERFLSDGEAGRALALENLRMALVSGSVSSSLSGLLSRERKAHLFEYAFSIIDDGMAFVLREDLLAGFNFESFAASSSSISVLDRLARFLYFLPDFPNNAKPLSLAKDFQFVHLSQEILSSLAGAKFSQPASELSPQQGDEEEDEFVKMAKRKRSQKQAKQGKRSRKLAPKIDQKPFLALKEEVPTTQSEAQELTLKLLVEQKELLSQFIDLLRDPLLAESIREQFMLTSNWANVAISAKSVENDLRDPLSGTETASDLSSAYPYVQPLKASLYFDSAEGLGEWRIFMSTTAVADLRGHRKSPKTFDVIIKKMRELSNGFFSEDNQKRLKGPSKSIPIFEAKLTSDLRLVYQIDCVSDYESKSEFQVIRVYGIFTHAQMDSRMWESLSAQLATRGAEYRKRIIFRKKPQVAGDNVYRPQSWPDICDAEEPVKDTSISSLVNAADLQSIHHWLVLEKYSAFSQALLNCIKMDKDSSPVFAVSPYERDIIEHPSSCYVLGRSGTGKTTTMAFKMFGIERTAQTHAIELDAKPRQLFVTQSRVLAGRVKEYYAKLSKFLSAASDAPHELSAESRQAEPDDGLGDPEDDEDWRDDLPKRFSELRESHFPLFLTFDKLCKLIEVDLGISFARPTYTKEHKRAERRFDLASVTANNDLDELDAGDDTGISRAANLITTSGGIARSSLVTFESFCANYWPHFPQNLSKNLDPALVFSEFLGVIKGSEESLKSEKPFLTREAYLNLSERTQSTFATQREKIYSLFDKYMTLKRQYGDYDAADRSHAIIRSMKEDYNISVDFLYVDEAQDNLIIDAFLLRRLCRNPHGLFWAGDTAQTIAIGSSFRFDDLKAALYGFERDLYPSLSEKIVVKPAFFQLTTNYRSHDGIVNCAEIIIELITHFWPHSIDALRKEKGMVDGSKPVFFTGWNDETARYEQFLLGENGNSVEFGAQQCILVRNDQARNELRKQVGEIGGDHVSETFLTLYESKGLEFDDVLLYNFFEDSPCVLSQWRAILDFLTVPNGSKKAVPQFDEIRHAGICTELKFLYVAVTRARKNLWIIDRSEKCNPMKTLLLQKGRVTICTPENAPKLAEASTSEEWAKTGKLLFSNKRYPQAMHCFERAGLPHERSIAEAYHLRHQARNIPRGKSEEVRNEAFLIAARAFFRCAQDSLLSQKKKYYHISAECFREAQDDGLAAQSYNNAEEYTNAARHYRKANMFDEAVEVIQTKEEMVDPVVAEKIIGASRLHYIHVERLDKALELFGSEEDGLEFMEDCGFDTARATILEKIGRIHEAAELHFLEGRSQQAIRLLLKDDQNPQSVRRAADYLLKSLWKQYSFGVDVKQHDTGAADSLSLARSLDKSFVTPEVTEELAMFDAISRQDKSALLSAYRKFHTMRKNKPATILILDHILRGSNHHLDNTQGVVRFLRACHVYAEVLRQVWNNVNATENAGTQKLFGFRKISEDEFLLTDGSFLASHAAGSRSASFRPTEAGVVLSLHELLRVIKSSITTRVLNMVQAQVIVCGKARNKLFGEACLNHAIQGQCNRGDCYRQHIDLRSADSTWYTMRIRIHLLQILFLQTADFALENSSDRLRLQNEWLTNLFNVLNPPLLALGSMANVSHDYDPEFSKGMNAVAIWIESRSYQVNPNHLHARWFLNTITEIATLGLYQDRDKARKLIQRARFYTGEKILLRHRADFERLRIPDLVRSLDTFDPEFIKSGCTFIHHVIRFRLTIDVGYLCRLIELLSAASVLLYENMRGDFHGCLLPRSWVAYLLPKLNLDQGYNLQAPIWQLIQRSGDVAYHLITRTDNETSYLRGARVNIVRNLVIQRICRATCLVGYNTNSQLRDLVVRVIVKLRGANSAPLHDVLKPYILSKTWPELRREAESSVPASGLDEMIQLVQDGRKPMRIFSNARVNRISFKNRDELLSLFSLARREESFKMSASAAIFVPGSVPSSAASIVKDDSQSAKVNAGDDSFAVDEADEAADDDRGEDEQENLLGSPAEVETSDEPTAHAATANIASKEENAARIILRCFRTLRDRRREKAVCILQRKYRAMRARRNEMYDSGVRGRRAKFYKDCEAIDLGRQWPSHHHRAVYLGLVPHLLVCLDALQIQIQSDKEKARKQFRLESKDAKVNYDEISLRLTRANDNRKHLDRLKKQVAAKSEWHVKRTLQDLRSLVLHVSTFLDQVKVGGVEVDISLAIKALVQEPKLTQPKTKSKPQLNVDDLDSIY